MSKSVFIQELVREDDGRWRMAIGEVGSAEILSNEMFPLGTQAPYGFTIEEEMIQHDPEIGHFYLAGVTEETVQAMEQGFADAFRKCKLSLGAGARGRDGADLVQGDG